MYLMFITFSLMALTILLLFNNHPMTIMFIIILTTLMVSALLGLMLSQWFMYVTILVYLGGMMILFIYLSILTSNDKLTFKSNSKLIILPFLISLMTKWPILEMSQFNMMAKYNNLSSMFTPLTTALLMMMTLILFISFLIVIKIVNLFDGPMFNKFNDL